ncbi:T9SS type A sorting domain-containing protein [Chitinophagaceae bacterium DXS]|nr:T9SS type A sorting domain-containing protein [Chitinophagaceae bacterium DXS]
MAHLLHRKPSLTKKAFLLVLLMAGSHVMFGHATGFMADDKEPKVIKCYPNPAVAFVNFEFDKSIEKTATLQIYSFTGKKMADMPVSNAKITVQLDEYFRGIYVYQLRDKTGRIIESGKFQVTK